MEGVVPGAEGEVHHAIYAQLPHILQPARPQVLPQLQCEIAGAVAFVPQVLSTPAQAKLAVQNRSAGTTKAGSA